MAATGTTGRWVAAGIAVAGIVGLGLLAIPAGAGAAPELPPVTAEALVSSVLTAKPAAFGGTVELDNNLGLPALPGLPQAANGTSTARIWSDGTGKARAQVPSASGERTFVADGTTFWSWDSSDKTVTKAAEGAERKPAAPDATTDPTAAATQAIEKLRTTSEVSVDGTAEVAGRPAYDLVLTPAPTERTLLREVRIAVDSQTRMPLQLTVLANGSSDPALQLGFSDLTFGTQDASLFTFTPPPGSTVTGPSAGDKPAKPEGLPAGAAKPTAVGDGWDTVLLASMPKPDTAAPQQPGRGGAADLSSLGTPVSGTWGSGRLVTTAVASAIITDDGRIAIGAVPEQVLTAALSK
jgi:outer membrane lipoprotein-sorting protein